MVAKRVTLLALDLQPVGADIDLQAVGLFPGLIEIVAERADRDDQSADDETQDVAVARHPGLLENEYSGAFSGCGGDSHSALAVRP